MPRDAACIGDNRGNPRCHRFCSDETEGIVLPAWKYATVNGLVKCSWINSQEQRYLFFVIRFSFDEFFQMLLLSPIANDGEVNIGKISDCLNEKVHTFVMRKAC